jgi:FixJ family two-component response regulator
LSKIRKLIIVEDDASMRRSLTRWAKVSGYEVFAFASASAFLACDIHTKDACLVLDLGLPDIGGGELKRRLVAAKRDLPTVFITGFTDAQIALAMVGVDAPRVLRKPFETGSLAAEIEALA